MEINQFVAVTDDPEFSLGTTLLYIDTRNIGEFLEPLEKQISRSERTPKNETSKFINLKKKMDSKMYQGFKKAMMKTHFEIYIFNN